MKSIPPWIAKVFESRRDRALSAELRSFVWHGQQHKKPRGLLFASVAAAGCVGIGYYLGSSEPMARQAGGETHQPFTSLPTPTKEKTALNPAVNSKLSQDVPRPRAPEVVILNRGTADRVHESEPSKADSAPPVPVSGRSDRSSEIRPQLHSYPTYRDLRDYTLKSH